jgi:hypothetical protein
LHERLRQAAALEAPFARLIADLDSDRFPVREAASRRLEAAGPAAEFALRLAVQPGAPLEVRNRIQQVLDKLAAPREEQIQRLIADLDGPRAAEASRQLARMGRAAEPALRRVLEIPPIPVRKRGPRLSQQTRWYVQKTLEQMKEPDTSSIPLDAEVVLRALSVLEQMNTREARQVFQELAKGPAGARVTREARAALERLAKRQPKP